MQGRTRRAEGREEDDQHGNGRHGEAQYERGLRGSGDRGRPRAKAGKDQRNDDGRKHGRQRHGDNHRAPARLELGVGVARRAQQQAKLGNAAHATRPCSSKPRQGTLPPAAPATQVPVVLFGRRMRARMVSAVCGHVQQPPCGEHVESASGAMHAKPSSAYAHRHSCRLFELSQRCCPPSSCPSLWLSPTNRLSSLSPCDAERGAMVGEHHKAAIHKLNGGDARRAFGEAAASSAAARRSDPHSTHLLCDTQPSHSKPTSVSSVQVIVAQRASCSGLLAFLASLGNLAFFSFFALPLLATHASNSTVRRCLSSVPTLSTSTASP